MPMDGSAHATGPGRPAISGGLLEVWGGVECSVVRVGDSWRDQVEETGHGRRGDADITRLAGLGLRTVRYPVLWEHAAQDPEWVRQDASMAALARHGIRVIGGLVHHGSGPQGTDLLDPEFGDKLAVHAGAAARRYPEMLAWTPVNEPLTTARFACLYGHWYPHGHDEDLFLRAVVNECRAVLLSMRAIRAAAPYARFVHTEDVGRVFATAPAAKQAAYENDRRWLSLDLLCGRVDVGHPWRARLLSCGASAHDLDALAGGEAAPDVIGVNHYVTSDRFLDHRLSLYPPHMRGGNGRVAYADTEAARVDLPAGSTGWKPRLAEVWERYRLPMAVTEVHLGCRDPRESVRWLMEAWDAVHALRAEGADIRAITPWGLFGLVDWDSMLRERRGHYEAGALDCRSDPPAPTILAEAITALATTGRFAHPALDQPGWWRRDERVHPALLRAAS